MEVFMITALDAIFHRRAVKSFDPVEIPPAIRKQILDAARYAPSSFNIQPYRFYWIESPAGRKKAAQLCYGQQPAETASALVVAVADIGSWQPTVLGQLEWMRTSRQAPEKISAFERRGRLVKWFFIQGWFNSLGLLKWAIFRLVHLWKSIGTPPISRQGLFKWATKSTSLACENLMIAAEALGLNTCPMEGFDNLRLSKFLGLSTRHHDIVMVIAIGKKSPARVEPPQWRRPLESTVTVL
jgi:nitroreductase